MIFLTCGAAVAIPFRSARSFCSSTYSSPTAAATSDAGPA